MRNRAKCKLCKEIIESFHRFDYVHCKCGEISVDGGTDIFNCGAKNWENFIRIDDADQEIQVKVLDPDTKDDTNFLKEITHEDRLDILRNLVNSYENLPQNALIAPVTGYDLYSALLIILSILADKK